MLLVSCHMTPGTLGLLKCTDLCLRSMSLARLIPSLPCKACQHRITRLLVASPMCPTKALLLRLPWARRSILSIRNVPFLKTTRAVSWSSAATPSHSARCSLTLLLAASLWPQSLRTPLLMPRGLLSTRLSTPNTESTLRPMSTSS